MNYAITIIAAALLAGCASTGSEPVKPTTAEGAEAATAPAAEREYEITRHRYSARLRGTEPLTFVNEHGDLRLRGSRDGGVHYAAVIQKLDGEQREPEFPTDRVDGGLRFEVQTPDDWIGRVDASARVPPASPLDLRTRDGLLEIKAGNADIVARTAGGAILYRGAGVINLRSESGDAHLSLSAGAPAETISKVYSGGDVELWLASDMNVDVELSAGGGIVSNVPADTAEVLQQRARRLRLQLGDGSRTLRVQARGTITVGALPAP